MALQLSPAPSRGFHFEICSFFQNFFGCFGRFYILHFNSVFDLNVFSPVLAPFFLSSFFRFRFTKGSQEFSSSVQFLDIAVRKEYCSSILSKKSFHCSAFDLRLFELRLG